MAHHPPAVTYPIRPSIRFKWSCWGIWALGCVVLFYWCFFYSLPASWLQGLLSLVCVLLAVVLARMLANTLQEGTLCWDGKCWHLSSELGFAPGTVTCLLDAQKLLWLQWKAPGRISRLCVLEQQFQPERWGDLRRAVFYRS